MTGMPAACSRFAMSILLKMKRENVGLKSFLVVLIILSKTSHPDNVGRVSVTRTLKRLLFCAAAISTASTTRDRECVRIVWLQKKEIKIKIKGNEARERKNLTQNRERERERERERLTAPSLMNFSPLGAIFVLPCCAFFRYSSPEKTKKRISTEKGGFEA